ncbi:MAG: hypothetical protein K6F92_08655 [Lachnospiraceae bacterium]|nr:hypothetical protein [Lachnospiraceae bacterium]
MKSKNKKKKKNEVFYKVFGVTFGAVVLGLSVFTLAYPDSDYSSAEKRYLAQIPELNVDTLADGSFMAGLEDYEADQFPFRAAVMQMRAGLDETMGKAISQGVTRLDGDHLAEVFEEPSEQAISAVVNAVNAFSARYPDIDMYMLLAPNAISVYSDKVAGHVLTDDQNTYIDGIYRGVSGAVTTIDIREAFAANRGAVELYYGTDHHWTTDGAYLAFTYAAKPLGISASRKYVSGVVNNTFSGTLTSSSGFSVGKLDDVKVYLPAQELSYTVEWGDGLRASCYLTEALTGDDPYEVFFGGNHASMVIKCGAKTGRSLLMFKDSYANCFIPFLIGEYDSITVIDPRYYYEDLDMLVASSDFTDVLFLYNANTLSTDNALATVLNNEQ